MASINKVIIVGNLGGDVECRESASGYAVANFRVATSYKRKDAETGDYTEETEWHRVTVFGRSAEACGQYLSKGSSVYVEGRLRTNKWQDESGNDRYTTEIVANDVQFLSRKSKDEPANKDQDVGKKAKKNAAAPSEDDIPF